MKYLRYTSPTARVVKTTLAVGSLYLMSAEGSIVATFTFFTIQNGLQTIDKPNTDLSLIT